MLVCLERTVAYRRMIQTLALRPSGFSEAYPGNPAADTLEIVSLLLSPEV